MNGEQSGAGHELLLKIWTQLRDWHQKLGKYLEGI